MTSLVKKAWKEKDFRVVVDEMMPQRYYSRTILSYYDMHVKDGILDSNLPYFGQVQVPSAYTAFPKGLNFTEEIREYVAVDNLDKRTVEIQMLVKNEEDSYLYNVRIFYDGKAEIMVKPQKRDYIRFRGELIENN